jgi:cephalosporin-C deacetylase
VFVDLPLEELREYRPEAAEPADFDASWRDAVAAARASTTATRRSSRPRRRYGTPTSST